MTIEMNEVNYKLDLQQVPKHPTKPSVIKESDLMPFKSSTSMRGIAGTFGCLIPERPDSAKAEKSVFFPAFAEN
jgi:hypothetical protein